LAGQIRPVLLRQRHYFGHSLGSNAHAAKISASRPVLASAMMGGTFHQKPAKARLFSPQSTGSAGSFRSAAGQRWPACRGRCADEGRCLSVLAIPNSQFRTSLLAFLCVLRRAIVRPPSQGCGRCAATRPAG
jgi:hypothetical protein